MPFNVYDGWTVEELLKERKRVQQRLSGGSVTEAGAAGVRVVKTYTKSPEIILEDLAYSLFLADPVKYPLQQLETRTRAVFSNPVPGHGHCF